MCGTAWHLGDDRTDSLTGSLAVEEKPFRGLREERASADRVVKEAAKGYRGCIVARRAGLCRGAIMYRCIDRSYIYPIMTLEQID